MSGQKPEKPGKLTGASRNQTASQRYPSQIHPVVLGFFADKGEFPHSNTSAALESCPTPPRDEVGLLGILLCPQLGDGHMRHVGPILVRCQGSAIQLVVQFAQLMSLAPYANEHGWSDRNECFYFIQRNFEGFNLAANPFQALPGFVFRSNQTARRKNSEMRGHVRQRRMEITPQLFDKLPHGVVHIGYQGIAAGLNHRYKIIRCLASLWDVRPNHGNRPRLSSLLSLSPGLSEIRL
jgi:hypothetical protein